MTTQHQLSFNVVGGDARDAAHSARSVIDEHCIVDHFGVHALTLSVAQVVIHFTAANEAEAQKIADQAVLAAQHPYSIDAVVLKTTPKRKGR